MYFSIFNNIILMYVIQDKTINIKIKSPQDNSFTKKFLINISSNFCE